MDHERKELLAQKKAQLKAKQQREEIQQYKDRLTKSIEDFSQKYRYADEDEWEVFSPCLLLVDEDFIHYTYINDDGEVMESQVS